MKKMRKSFADKGIHNLSLKWQDFSRISKARISGHSPFLLYHYITTRCSCKCPYCYYVGGINQDLTTVEILSVYEQAKDLGYLAALITGGEPFTRKDLPDLLRYIHDLDFAIHLMTNGNHLKEQWDSVKNYVHTLLIGVDIADDELDQIRRHKDSFQTIVLGIEHVRSLSPKLPILINAPLWKQNESQVFDLALFAKDMNAMINYYPIDAFRQYKNNEKDSRESLAIPYEKLSEHFKQIHSLKKEGYPVFNSDSYINFYIKKKPPFTCHFQQVFTQIMANGDVVDCSSWGDPFGNVRTNTLEKIINTRQAYRARKRSQSCNACNRSEVIEISLAYQWHMDALRNILKLV